MPLVFVPAFAFCVALLKVVFCSKWYEVMPGTWHDVMPNLKELIAAGKLQGEWPAARVHILPCA